MFDFNFGNNNIGINFVKTGNKYIAKIVSMAVPKNSNQSYIIKFIPFVKGTDKKDITANLSLTLIPRQIHSINVECYSNFELNADKKTYNANETLTVNINGEDNSKLYISNFANGIYFNLGSNCSVILAKTSSTVPLPSTFHS